MIKNILKKLNIDNNTPIVIGCSAGPDSMALLHMTKKELNNQIIVAHINHNLRKESKDEEKYLKKYCKDNNITFESTSIIIDKNKNIENEARKKRYNFYKEILNKYNTKYLLLAHHGDDLIETILMKIDRGSNLEGYAGIKEITYPNNYNDYYIIRPLLSITKEEIINYNKENNIKYFIDNSNYDTKYTRNRYRKNILPILKQENKNIHKSFYKYSKTLLEYDQYIKEETNNKITECYNNSSIDLNIFKKYHNFIQKQILYKLLSNIYNDKPNIIKEKHIISIINIINNKTPNLITNLPNNYIALKEYNKLYIKNNDYKNNDYKIEFNNITKLDDWIIEKIDKSDKDGNDICRLNSKEIKFPLYIRNKKNSDTIELKGSNKHKKVSDIFIEKKIPVSKRNKYPILIDSNNNILWIPNLKKTKFNAKKDEFYDIILRYNERKENNE